MKGLRKGDIISAINKQKTQGLNYADVQLLIKNSQEQLQLEITREEKSPSIHVNGDIPDRSPTESRSISTGDSNAQLNAADTFDTRFSTITSTAANSFPSSTALTGSSTAMATTYRPPKKGDFPQSSHHFMDEPNLDTNWSEQELHTQASPSPPMWSKRPILPPASPKLMTHNTTKALPLFKPQPVSRYEGQGMSESQSQSVPRASSVGRGDSKSKGMNLFRRQQEKLAQLGADVQEINVSDSQFGTFEPHQAYSAQSSPGGIVPYTPSRSFSIDEGARTVPIIVQTGTNTASIEGYRPRRMRSTSEHADSYYVRPAHDSGFSPWQSGLQEQPLAGKNFGVGSYATLPAKPLSGLQHKPAALSLHEKVPPTQPLTVDADQPINDFDYHIYSTLPTIKPLRTNNHRLPIDLPELEKEAKFRDFSKPLWANTDLPGPSQPSGDDSHSPPSDNAVSSSDSRDTIIARSDDTKLSASQTSMEVRNEPKMIPVKVVHEESGRGFVPERPAGSAREKIAEFELQDQPWEKRVVEGADHSLGNASLEPRTLQEKPQEPQVNGIKGPSITPSVKPGVWTPGASPLAHKSDVENKKQYQSTQSPQKPL
ncbi:uncharacterized protein LOC112562770 isoform X3 [Pomacea canaliculata]|uniref:uncharacterized protein LOC112562770 isoform X3 n=1 Tax=Pomacea canaliculata TaxID=400727 RepID=UPI000D73B92D|nr:uncharacterized protein LOC112562770 isoform X3 [Pomacea canaliculata]